MATLTREKIDAEHFVARYVRGDLTESEREAFEEYCVLHPEVADEVRTDRVLVSGLHALQKSAAPRRAWRPWALAASVLLGIVSVVWVGYRSVPLPDAPAIHSASADELHRDLTNHVAGPIAVVRLRSGNVQELRVDAQAKAVKLAVEPQHTLGASELEVSFEEYLEGQYVARDRIRVSVENSVAPVIVDLGALRAPLFRLTLRSPSGATDVFELRVERTP